MKNKKLAILATLCLVTATATVATGCKLFGGGGSDPVYEVTLSVDALELTIGDSETLVPNYTQVSGTTLAFTSSNPSVATVDETGKITAVSRGTAKITATYGTATDTCTVNVGLGGFTPTLQLPNATETEVTLNMWNPLDLSGTVTFNGKDYTDATLTYDVSDPSVGTVENGEFVPASFGTTDVTITATWRGITFTEAPLLTKTISVTVIPNWDYTVNNEELVYDVTLYTIEEEGYATQMPFEVVATENGAPISATVEVTKGSGVVTYDATAQTLTSAGVSGKATITVSVEIAGVPMSKDISVTVLPTIYQYEEVVENFSAIHGDVADDGQGTYGKNLKEILGENIFSAYTADGTALKVAGNKVYGVPASREGEFETTITVCSETKGYEMTVKGYSGVFAKAQDFAVFNTNTDVKVEGTGAIEEINAGKGMQVWDGYYVLANNIDATEYEHEAPGKNFGVRGIDFDFPCGLIGGTFDGQGYTVKGMTFNQFGLFGYVKDSVIKNVAFVETKHRDVNYTTTLAQYILGGTISNVYVEITNTIDANDELATKFTTRTRGAYFAGGLKDVNLYGIVIDGSAITIANEEDISIGGSFIYRNDKLFNATEETLATINYNEVYVIAPFELGYNKDNNQTHFIGANETAPAEPAEGATYVNVPGVKRYDTASDMQNDEENNTFENFNSEFWTVTNGKPVWNTADEYFAPPAEEEEEKSDTVVGDFKPGWLN